MDVTSVDVAVMGPGRGGNPVIPPITTEGILHATLHSVARDG
jgi:hypothetical protein